MFSEERKTAPQNTKTKGLEKLFYLTLALLPALVLKLALLFLEQV